jgi:hypothetical protein
VTKDTLLAAVWPDTVVSEDVRTATMRQLRRVLGDQSRPPQFIEMVPVGAIASSRWSRPRRRLASQWRGGAARRTIPTLPSSTALRRPGA